MEFEVRSEVDRTLKVVCRLGVDYKIKSKEGKITVVHHDRLKRSYAPLNDRNVICLARELGGDLGPVVSKAFSLNGG